MSKYYSVIEEDNERKYMYYKQAIMWNVEMIAAKQNADGYVIQKVKITNSTGILDIDEHIEYYEAWRYIDGKLAEDDEDGPDDLFSCGFDGIENIMINKSLGKKGEVRYDAEIYWVDAEDPLFNVVDKWENRGVRYAGRLKSILVENCLELDGLNAIEKRIFVHQVTFCDRNTIKATVEETYKVRLNMGDEEMRFELDNIFEDTVYEDIAEEICIKYGIK